MNVTECLVKRKSIRHFRNKEIEDKFLFEILNAGIAAPSPKNIQPWRFKIIRKGIEKNRILNSLSFSLEGAKKEWDNKNIIRKDIEAAFESVRIMQMADILIFVFLQIDKKDNKNDGVQWELEATEKEVTYIQAIGACIENMLLKATSLGIGSLWLCDFLYGYNAILEEMKIELPLIGMVALGYPDEIEKKIPKKERIDLNELIL